MSRYLVAIALFMMMIEGVSHAGKLIFETAHCDDANLEQSVRKALALALASEAKDCRRNPALRQMAQDLLSDRLPKNIYVRCAKKGGWPKTTCGTIEGLCVPDKTSGLVPAQDAYVRVTVSRELQLPGYEECPLIPSSGDYGITIIHELAHAYQVVMHQMRSTAMHPGTGTTETQWFAIQMENALRRAQGGCQRRHSGGLDRPAERLPGIIEPCECDPTDIDKLGAKPCPPDKGTCCSGVCKVGSCGPSSLLPACNYIDSALASSLIDTGVEKTDTMQGSFSCNFYGDPDPRIPAGREPSYRRIATLLATPHQGVDVKRWAKLELEQGVQLKTTPRQLDVPLGLIAFAWLEGDRVARQIHVLLPNATLNLSVWGKEGVPTNIDAMVATLHEIIKRIDPTFVSPPPPNLSDTGGT